MNEAIKLAIEKGGYDKHHSCEGGKGCRAAKSEILDPLFWQALGKALDAENLRFAGNGQPMRPAWLVYALRYHEVALTGGDTEKFWKDLLK